jgi:putative hydrolase of the HAD superfamily
MPEFTATLVEIWPAQNVLSMALKAVLFDAGGTLLRPEPSVGTTYAKVAAEHGVRIAAPELDARLKQAWKKQKALQLNVDKEWWRAVVTDVFAGDLFKAPDAFFEDLYRAFANPAVWKIYPDVIPALTALKEKNICLAIASNWDERLPRLLKELRMDRYFDYIFISSLVGYSKPDRRFFEHALKMTGFDPSDVLHVGDDIEEDIAGANNVGIPAVLVDRTKDTTLMDLIVLD